MCCAIVHDLHNPKAIATGCADPSYKCTTLWEARLAAIMHAPAAYRSLFVKILLRRYCSHHLQYGGEL
jgi:hypothetical protein